MIYEVHRKVKNNIGDAYCNPSRYFSFDNLKTEEVLNKNLNIKDENLIIGGGGLIHKEFQFYLKSLLDQSPKKSVIWAIGHNFGPKHVSKCHADVYFPSWLRSADLVGIRDWIPEHEDVYLPCVSCMHNAFDKEYESKFPVGFFIHSYKTAFEYKLTDRVLENKYLDFENAIKFLGESQIVVTDSYHGAYWAQLLGKPVITGNWSVKFHHFKYPVTRTNNLNEWFKCKLPAMPPTNFLNESRNLNKNFYQKVLKLFEK